MIGENKGKDFLLEINVEELPVGYIQPALDGLCNSILKELDAERIEYDRGSLLKGGTKNLLILYVKNLSIRQKEFSKKVFGPPKNIIFDEKGEPTKQAFGFVKAHGAKIEDLKFESTSKGEYVYVEKKEASKNTRVILEKTLPSIIRDIHFPKTMKWDASGLRFARPIQSVLGLFGKKRLNIKIGNCLQKKVSAIEPAEYIKQLQKKYLIEPDKRKEDIKKLILGSLSKLKADHDVDANLLEEVNFMVDRPAVFIGEFDKRYLALPEDVLKASMAKYQRVFPVLQRGMLIDKFIAVIEGNGRDIAKIKRNYEHILEARLKDSLFFYNEDLKKTFPDYNSQLKDLIFQTGLGNMSEKIWRLKELSLFICEKLKVDSHVKNNVLRAAEFSKADLATHMVFEFPSLQGVMGMEYSLKFGEKKEVAIAIKEHYFPKSADGDLPSTLEGSILAISDRMDNIVGFIGIQPDITSSFDPLGIRRNAQGLIQIIKERSFRLELNDLIHKGVELYGNKLKIEKHKLGLRIINYIKERMEFLIGDVKPLELKEAVLSVGCSDIVNVFKKMKALSSISKEESFLKAAKVVERTSNILKGAKGENIPDVSSELFKEDLEKKVWQRYMEDNGKIKDLIGNEKYVEATEEYGKAFFEVLHEFFDKVMVNAEDKELRLNRLAMMKAINRLYTDEVADLAKLPQIVVR